MGWDKLENGDLIRAAEPSLDVMVASDQHSMYQQNLAGRKRAIVVLPTNFLPTLLRLAPKVASALATIQAGDIVKIQAD
ncbi:MAG: hypothetical protein AAB676_03585 [Verrucomicrobiota bacterium]